MLPAPEAQIFWLPQEDSSTVILTDAPEPLRGTILSELPVLLADPRIDSDGTHALMPISSAQRLQIHRTGTGSPVAVIPLDIHGFSRLEAVHRLLATLHNRVPPPDTRLTSQQRARAKRMLQAYDGGTSGATQQDIAQTLFQLSRLSRNEWQISSWRHAVMSLLKDARKMVSGEYRKLLRHRRKP